MAITEKQVDVLKDLFEYSSYDWLETHITFNTSDGVTRSITITIDDINDRDFKDFMKI
jgi:VCBS repeat-containing protein